MSRGVRDLRELICVSRLSVVESDGDEDRASNNTPSCESASDQDRLNRSLRSLSLQSSKASYSSESSTGLPKQSRNKKKTSKNKSNNGAYSRSDVSDERVARNGKGITNGSAGVDFESRCVTSEEDRESPKITNGATFLPNRCTKSSTSRSVAIFPVDYCELVGKKPGSRPPWMQRGDGVARQEVLESRSRLDDLCDEAEPDAESRKLTYEQNGRRGPELAYADRNYDELLTSIDADVLSVWLENANRDIQDLDEWCHAGDNFVQAAHIWLSSVSDAEKSTILEREHSELARKLRMTFPSGSGGSKTVTEDDIYSFLGAVFREYPTRMLGAKGAQLFLNYLDVLSSDKRESYRMLLSDVKCWTLQPQHAQWILAIRSVALVSVWTAIVCFVRKRLDESSSSSVRPSSAIRLPSARPSSRAGATSRMETNNLKPSTDAAKCVNSQRMYQAIRNGYIDVMQCFFQSGNVAPKLCDAHDRSLVFYSVMYNQPRVLHFLTSQMSDAIDVNGVADSGNSALHAAANTGHTELVRLLLGAKNINVNIHNSFCENATPLHLAVLHGHCDVVRLLLSSGADPLLNMGSTSAIDLATDFDHVEILDMLKQCKR